MQENGTYIREALEGRVLVLTIDNPPNNLMPPGFFDQLHRALPKMDDERVRAVVITATGRSFSKGADLSLLRAGSPMLEPATVKQANRVFDHLEQLRKPVVAAINGACFGGGLELAMACHIRVACEKALLGLPEVSAGLVPGLGGVWRLARLVGKAKAREMILLGDMVSAAAAERLNLVSRVFPRKDFMRHTLNFVNTILAAPQEAIDGVYRLFSRVPDGEPGGLAEETAALFCGLAARLAGQ